MPRVSIGLPVYNGAATLRAALDSLLGQTLTDFDLIISDNCSTDETGAICQEYAAKDPRIRYVRQPSNIGPIANFLYVLEAASAPLFTWAAHDDVRTRGFLKATVEWLECSPAYVSASATLDHGRWCQIDHSTAAGRFLRFFRICWFSNALFYGVHRTAILRQYPLLDGTVYAGLDWTLVLFLARRGNFFLSNQEGLTFGPHGASNQPGKWRALRTEPIELLFPLWRMARYAWSLSAGFNIRDRVALAASLLRVNFAALYNQAFSAAYQFYKKRFRHLLRGPA